MPLINKCKITELILIALMFYSIFNNASAAIALEDINATNWAQPLSSDSTNEGSAIIQSLQTTNPNDLLSEPPAQSVSLKLPPVQSVLLSPGKVTSQKINLPLLQPIFIIGSDKQSLEWLSNHVSQLKALHAVGLLVNEENEDDLENIKKVSNGIPIIPVFGDEIARALQLKHYPALITSAEITQ